MNSISKWKGGIPTLKIWASVAFEVLKYEYIPRVI